MLNRNRTAVERASRVDCRLFKVNRGRASAWLLVVAWLWVVTRFFSGSAGAGGADAASLVCGSRGRGGLRA